MWKERCNDVDTFQLSYMEKFRITKSYSGD